MIWSPADAVISSTWDSGVSVVTSITIVSVICTYSATSSSAVNGTSYSSVISALKIPVIPLCSSSVSNFYESGGWGIGLSRMSGFDSQLGLGEVNFWGSLFLYLFLLGGNLLFFILLRKRLFKEFILVIKGDGISLLGCFGSDSEGNG